MKRAHVLCGIGNIGTIHDTLKNKRLGLMTHPCGYNADLKSSIDILYENYDLKALFGCEHGLRGDAQDALVVGHETDQKTGLPIFSLYGETRTPTEEMLSCIDTMIIDLQDVGARFYTFIYSMAYAMIACSKYRKQVIVLDRINPIGGRIVQGTLLDERFHSFVGEYAIPTRYALTIGEFALFLKDKLQLDLDLRVVPMTGWSRDMLWDDTDAIWTPPSPNMPSPLTALLYIGTCIFEGTNISEGRGTTTPFSIIGAPFIDSDKLCARLSRIPIDGIGFLPARFTPTFSKWKDVSCHGVRVYAKNTECDAFAAGLYLLETILDMYPNDAKFLYNAEGTEGTIRRLLGTDLFPEKLDAHSLIELHKPLIEDFACHKTKYHLYE